MAVDFSRMTPEQIELYNKKLEQVNDALFKLDKVVEVDVHRESNRVVYDTPNALQRDIKGMTSVSRMDYTSRNDVEYANIDTLVDALSEMCEEKGKITGKIPPSLEGVKAISEEFKSRDRYASSDRIDDAKKRKTQCEGLLNVISEYTWMLSRTGLDENYSYKKSYGDTYYDNSSGIEIKMDDCYKKCLDGIVRSCSAFYTMGSIEKVINFMKTYPNVNDTMKNYDIKSVELPKSMFEPIDFGGFPSEQKGGMHF